MSVSFLALPPELRNAIYALLLVREEPIDALYGYHELSPSILATNKTILHEARSLLYGHNRFDLISWNHDFALRFLDSIGSVNASHLQCICIDFPRFDNLENNIDLNDMDHRTLEKIQTHCINLHRLIISAKYTSTMEDLFRSWVGQEVRSRALALVDASSRAIPSLRKTIAEVYKGEPSSDIIMEMESHGWIINVVEDVQDVVWEMLAARKEM